MPSYQEKGGKWEAKSRIGQPRNRSTYLGRFASWSEARLVEIEYQIEMLKFEAETIREKSA